MLAVGETVIPLHHPLPVVVVSIVMERESVSKMTVSPMAKACAQSGTTPDVLYGRIEEGETLDTETVATMLAVCRALVVTWPGAS